MKKVFVTSVLTVLMAVSGFAQDYKGDEKVGIKISVSAVQEKYSPSTLPGFRTVRSDLLSVLLIKYSRSASFFLRPYVVISVITLCYFSINSP